MRFGIQRVVKVLGIFAVDGDERQIAQVNPRFGLGRINALAEVLGFAQGFLRKLMRQIKARERRLGTQFHRTRRIKTLLNYGRCGRRRACIATDARDDPIAISRTGEIRRSHGTAQLQAPVGGAHPGRASLKLNRAQE
jgi:hypothetical protein